MVLLGEVLSKEVRDVTYSFFPYDSEMPILYFVLNPVISSIDMFGFPIVHCIVRDANCAFVVALMVRRVLRIPDSIKDSSALDPSFCGVMYCDVFCFSC